MKKLALIFCVIIFFQVSYSQDTVKNDFGVVVSIWQVDLGLFVGAGTTFNLTSRGNAFNPALTISPIQFLKIIRPQFVWDYEGSGVGISVVKGWAGFGLANLWTHNRSDQRAKFLFTINLW